VPPASACVDRAVKRGRLWGSSAPPALGAAAEALPGERLLAVEVTATEERRLAGRRRFSCLPAPYRLKDFDFEAQPRIDRKLVEELGTLRFIEEAANVLFIGRPGMGKTMLAVALGKGNEETE
jgi:DNA replication protein DnaC